MFEGYSYKENHLNENLSSHPEFAGGQKERNNDITAMKGLKNFINLITEKEKKLKEVGEKHPMNTLLYCLELIDKDG